jgi:hypothetical protein
VRLEASAWKQLRPHLNAYGLDPVRVENPVHPGTPDVNLASGAWLELKALERFPERPAALVRIPHFTPQQRVWLLRRWRAGGGAWLALYIATRRAWFVFDGATAAEHVGRVSYGQLAVACTRCGSSEFVARFFAEQEPGFRLVKAHGLPSPPLDGLRSAALAPMVSAEPRS